MPGKREVKLQWGGWEIATVLRLLKEERARVAMPPPTSATGNQALDRKASWAQFQTGNRPHRTAEVAAHLTCLDDITPGLGGLR